MLMLLIGLLVGCTQPAAGEEDTASADLEESPVVPEEEVPSVALALNGSTNDGGWNASGYNSLMVLAEKYGAEVSYTEEVSQSDMEEVFRGYAELGFDIMVGHGSQFTDAITNVAPSYPDQHFIIINGNDPAFDNVSCVQLANEHTGFLMGSFAALMTKSGTVGFIGGMDIPPITLGMKGFEAGAKFINPDIEVLSTIIGNAQDAAMAKETASAFIDAGADILGHVANNAGLGVIEATQERQIRAIGSMIDQYDIAPDTVMVSVLNNNELMYDYFYARYVDGSLEQKVYKVGLGEEAVFMSPYHGFEDQIPEAVKQEMQRVEEAILAGELTL